MRGVAGTWDDRAMFRRRGAPAAAIVGPIAVAFVAVLTAAIVFDRSENRPLVVATSVRPAPASPSAAQRTDTPPPVSTVLRFDSALLDASYALGAVPAPFGERPPQPAHFVALAPPPVLATAEVALLPPLAPVPASVIIAELVPLPSPRPSALQTLAPSLARTPQARPVMAAKPSVGEETFFDRLFRSRPEQPALAYASPEIGLFSGAGRTTYNPTKAYDGVTAVYDISAHTVYLPNGTRLEAHSGLGSRLDDARYVAEHNRGPTPPHLYDLTPREQLFHGVAALRLNPVGGGGIFGRTGLLAHTYMLGPNGDSNGCVSFSNYQAFLAAYQRGDIRRLAVVARLN